jgi:hypothetical protein
MARGIEGIRMISRPTSDQMPLWLRAMIAASSARHASPIVLGRESRNEPDQGLLRLAAAAWNSGSGSTGVPCHHFLISALFANARCRCGALAIALPVNPT